MLVPALALLLLVISPVGESTLAKAPPLATTVLETEALSAPDYDATLIAVVPAGVEVELTGEAAPGFLGVYYDGQAAFVPAQYLSLGERPRIDTAVAIEDTPLLDAPMRDADVRLTVPEGQTVIITGATVDGYDAAAYEGTGGWINGRTLTR
jgi:hypothetical protein